MVIKITLKKQDKVQSKLKQHSDIIKMHRKYLNGYYYWVNLDTGIIYDDAKNGYSRIGHISNEGEYVWINGSRIKASSF